MAPSGASRSGSLTDATICCIRGHVSLLKSTAAECGRLVVVINSDESVGRLKGPFRPVQDERSRAYVVSALSAVDLVVVFDEDTPAETIAAHEPDLLVKGCRLCNRSGGRGRYRSSIGGRVHLVPLVKGHSTSLLIRRAAKSEES